MAFEDLAVIADHLDCVVGPFLVETERLAHAGGDAKHALDAGILALRHFVDVLLGDASLLGLEQRIDDPVDDVVPLLVAMAHDRGQRLLRDALGQDNVIVGFARPAGPLRGQSRGVTGNDIATARKKRREYLIDLLDDDRLELHLGLAEIVRQVELARRPRRNADRGAVQFLGAFDTELLRQHEALAIVEHHRAEIQAEIGVALQRPGRVVRQDVDFARLQRGEALHRTQGHVFDLFRIARDRRLDRLADIDVEAGVLALAVGHAKTRDPGRNAAHEAALLDLVEGRSCLRRARPNRRDTGRRDQMRPYPRYHRALPVRLRRILPRSRAG